ncbi:MAG: acetolactate synthase small subunit [Nitrososphaerales archaeon]
MSVPSTKEETTMSSPQAHPTKKDHVSTLAEDKKQANELVYAIVENQRGVLHRISGMFRAKGFNITSISIGESSSPDIARMTMVPKGDEASLQLLVKQLQKMIDVIEVGTMNHSDSIVRELALVKLDTHHSKSRHAILELSNNLGARAVDVARDSLVVEFTATPERIDYFIEEASKSGAIKEVVRTGLTALRRGL